MLAWQTSRFTELAVDPSTRRPSTTSTWCRSGPSRWSRSPSTASSARPATRAGWRCGSREWSATATTGPRPRQTRSRRC